MTAESELRLKATSQGFEEAAGQVDKLGDAQGKVIDKTKDSVKPTEELSKKQDKLKASTEDYTSVIGRINPMLGAMFDGMVKGAKVAGDVATQNISIRDAAGKAASGIRNMAGSMKLLLAGGAAAAGLLAIAKAFFAIGEEGRRNKEIIEAQTKALIEQKKAQEDLIDAIKNASDARLRFNALSVEEQQAAAQTAKRIADRSGTSLGSAASVVSDFAGANLTNDELGQAAQLREAGRLKDFDVHSGSSLRRHFLNASVKRNEEFLQQKAANQRERRRRLANQARQVLGQIGGDTSALAEFSEPFLSPDQDPEKFAQDFQKVGVDIDEVGALVAPLSALLNKFTGNRTVRTAGPQPVQLTETDTIRLPAREVSQMHAVLQAILAEIQRTNLRPFVAQATFIAPEANRYVTNGETLAASMEP